VCDFAFSVPEAKFGYTEVRIGFVPAIVSTFLIRKIGESKARDLLLTGRLIRAGEAVSLGMISKVVEKNSLEKEVKTFAQEIVTTSSAQSLATTKMLISEVQGLSLDDALNLAAKENAQARSTADCKKGIESFLGKKDLKW
jgi:methylglutaconyl-CoA hydratase